MRKTSTSSKLDYLVLEGKSRKRTSLQYEIKNGRDFILLEIFSFNTTQVMLKKQRIGQKVNKSKFVIGMQLKAFSCIRSD